MEGKGCCYLEIRHGRDKKTASLFFVPAMYMYWLRNVEKDQDTRKITQKSRSVRYFLERRQLFVITRYTEKLLYTAERMFQTSTCILLL